MGCGIVGAVSAAPTVQFDRWWRELMKRSTDRGEDSWGWQYVAPKGVVTAPWRNFGPFPDHSHTILPRPIPDHPFAGVGTLRGEPATEWVQQKKPEDIPPFMSPSGNWIFAHNGVIANDGEIMQGYREEQLSRDAFSPAPPTRIDSYAIGILLDRYGFKDACEMLKGSFAILAVHKSEHNRMWWGCNYKPLYALRTQDGVLFASQRAYFDGMYDPLNDPSPVQLGPYAAGNVQVVKYGSGQVNVLHADAELYPAKAPTPDRVLVVCSGGLDSATVAYLHKKTWKNDVTLLHFAYSCRAQGRELDSIGHLAADLGCSVQIVETDFFNTTVPSVLTNEGTIAPGAVGAELSTEWVPARNLVFASLALAIAERDNYDCVAFGTNQEEGCAFVDNEQETYEKLRQLVPFAVAPYRHIRISDPLGGLMKHQIVTLGAKLQVPHQYTYSCYKGGELHCGTCGPCLQRSTAFRMANVPDPTRYLDQTSSAR